MTTISTFKSSLPPRKRAKTQEEKEQRRIERILRNRRAAHASREKKRKHVEFLENYVVNLEKLIEKLNSNESTMKGKLSEFIEMDTLNLMPVEDLSVLKQKFESDHGIVDEGEDAEIDEDEDEEEELKHKIKIKVEDTDDNKHVLKEPKVKSSLTRSNLDKNNLSNSIKKENKDGVKKEDDDLFVYNYLSPISIQSPIQSPYNLSLSIDQYSDLSKDLNHELGDLQQDIEINELNFDSNFENSNLSCISNSNLSCISNSNSSLSLSSLNELNDINELNKNDFNGLNLKNNEGIYINDYNLQNSEVILYTLIIQNILIWLFNISRCFQFNWYIQTG